MDAVFINTVTLLDIIEKNREKHVKDALASKKGYEKKVIKGLEDALKQALSGEDFITNLELLEPEEHIKDYDKVIRMLNLSVDDTLKISSRDFDRYVMDNWDWKHNFRMSNAFYAAVI